jgi:hypothetical protein
LGEPPEVTGSVNILGPNQFFDSVAFASLPLYAKQPTSLAIELQPTQHSVHNTEA